MEIKVICGTNHFLIEEKLKHIKENSLGEVLRIEGSDISKDELSVSLSSFSMFEEKRIQIIDSFLIRIIDEEKTGDWDNLFTEIIPPGSPNSIFFVEKFEDEIELNLFLKKKIVTDLNCEIEVVNTPSGRGGSAKITDWIRSREKDLGLNLNNNQRMYMTYESNKDYSLLDNELKKLAIFSKGEAISDNDFTQLVSFSKNYKIFDLLDMFFANRVNEISKIINNLFSSGVKSNEIVALMNSEIHKVLQIKYLIIEKKSVQEISQITGIKSKYYFDKLFSTAKNIDLLRLIDTQNSLLQFDVKSKTQRFDQDLELELLLISK
ncbi:MAG: hypothetical protein FI674_03420 [SAR202 cluster bacterium]|nr:hypothetical protein [SAR202 cluster bacterium]|tara:strand:+ start:451 stop:1413 length:963 start_codon:yes stop_codon:yes gene_type:complete